MILWFCWSRRLVATSKMCTSRCNSYHPQNIDNVIKWKHFRRHWSFARGIHRSPRNSPHKGQWRGALMFSLICVWINGSVNIHEAGDLRCYRAHYDVTVMRVVELYHEDIMTWNAFRITGFFWGETTAHNGSIMWRCNVSFVVSLNNLLNKQSTYM